MTTFFIADTHFGHESIIKNCARPFKDAAQMDATMIANWNAVVGKNDDVWHLGDFAFRAKPDYMTKVFEKLNGHKHLIIGNHDDARTLKLRWASVHAMHNVTVNGEHVFVCHYGMRVWPRSHGGSIQLYGHSHGSLEGWRQSCDVGVDEWSFTPQTLDAIKARLALLPNASPAIGLGQMGDEEADEPEATSAFTV